MNPYRSSKKDANSLFDALSAWYGEGVSKDDIPISTQFLLTLAFLLFVMAPATAFLFVWAYSPEEAGLFPTMALLSAFVGYCMLLRVCHTALLHRYEMLTIENPSN